MQYTVEEKAMIWLGLQESLDDRERAAILRAAKNPALLFKDAKRILSTVIKSSGNRLYNITGAQIEKEAEEGIASLEEKGYFAITLLSDDYPEALAAIPNPPLVLFGAGNRELLKKRKFAIVGSRITPPWAEKQCKAIAEEVSKRFAVVTGLAEGGDAAAIDGALKNKNVISVLPNGLDECYPAGHLQLKNRIRESGLLLTEYAPKVQTKKYFFQARNRIIAGLAEGVLVVSAREKRSGALITSSCAAEFGRDVFAFPYNIGSAYGGGCNELIKKGAYLVTGAEDVLSAYGMEVEKREEIPLTEEEARVLAALKEEGEAHTAVLAQKTGMQVFEIIAVLSSLEIKNLAVKSGGNRYAAL